MSDTPAQEDCLLALHQLGARGQPVATTALARALHVSAPTATAAVKRLAQEGLVRHTPYRGAQLTAAGRKIARNVLRRHRLIESFLVAIMGYAWDEVHEEAHRLEHAVSARFVDRLDARLGHPQFDPHGDPIPTVGGRIAPEPSLSLADLAGGETGTVEQMQDEEAGFLRFARAHGLVPGAKIKVVEVGEYQGPIRVRSRGQETSLTASVAGRILVSRSRRRRPGVAVAHSGGR